MEGSPKRKVLISALDYPRWFVCESIRRNDCRRDAYDPDARECSRCEIGAECRWLSNVDQFTPLTREPVGSLMETLTLAREHVHRRTMQLDHNVKACVCETCSWLRQTRRLLLQISES